MIIYKKISNFIKKYPWLLHILILLTFVGFIFYYMTPQTINCTTTVYGFGDNTSGPIWRYEVSPNSPFWGPEKVTNYPFGESLYSPVNYSASAQYVFYWILAKIAGPICGYNLFNFIGLFFSAAVMYGFIYKLTRKKSIAWLSGYLVAFSPYYQTKIGGNPSYAYQGILIGTIWLYYNLLKYRKLKNAIFLGLIISLSFYFDPYFVLLELIILLALTLAWLIDIGYKKYKVSIKSVRFVDIKAEIQRFKLLIVAALITCLVVSPLAAVRVIDNKQINSYVSSSRGNILIEAKDCSNLPYEYLLPSIFNPFFSHTFGKTRYQNAITSLNSNFSCGIGEDTIGLSITALIITILGLIIFMWEKINKRKLYLTKNLDYEPRSILLSAFLIGFIAMLIGLPPIKYHGIPSPSYELLSITTTWRTLARVYVDVNISLTILFAIVLTYFSYLFKKKKKILIILFTVLTLFIFIEYQAFSPLKGDILSNFNYSRDAPKAYYWLAKQKNIKVTAEYPIETEGESDALAYYLTMQSIDHKKLFNSALPNSPQEIIRASLKNLSDPQTVPALHTLGIDTIIIHGSPASSISQIPYLKIIYTAPQSPFNLLSLTKTITKDNIVIAKIVNAPILPRMMELRNGEFPRNTNIIHSAIDWEYEALQNSHIDVKPITKIKKFNNPLNLCFSIRMSLPNDSSLLTIISDGKPQSTVNINSTYKEVQASAYNYIQLHDSNGHNMEITNLGCP